MKWDRFESVIVGKTSGKRNFHDRKQIIHESRIPHEINHASRTNFCPYHVSRINPLPPSCNCNMTTLKETKSFVLSVNLSQFCGEKQNFVSYLAWPLFVAISRPFYSRLQTCGDNFNSSLLHLHSISLSKYNNAVFNKTFLIV